MALDLYSPAFPICNNNDNSEKETEKLASIAKGHLVLHYVLLCALCIIAYFYTNSYKIAI